MIDRRTLLKSVPVVTAMPLARASASDAVPSRKSLVIVGGGPMPDSVRDRFMRLAGGDQAKLVVIPTASEYADDPKEHASYSVPWRKYEPATIALMHTRSRAEADTAAFAGPIRNSTAVWFSGGDQSKLTDAYRGTAVHQACVAVLASGGVVGGTSAGAAVMSDVMITGGRERATVGKGFGFLKQMMVDQHFLRRSRLNRLLGVVYDHPGIVGVGIDESTAFVIEEDRWSVVGESFVLIVQRGEKGGPPRMAALKPGSAGTIPRPGEPFLSGSDVR